jgi:hypothetical protein
VVKDPTQVKSPIRTRLKLEIPISNKTSKQKWLQWLTPLILATQKTEIRRIKVRSQPRQNSLRDPLSKKKKNHKKGLVEWFKV